MSEKPKISILVPVYNSEEYLPRFLDSALQQSFEDYEVICVDNQSTDGSFEILKKYKEIFPDKISVFQTDTHGGVAKGRNTAFRNSKGDYLFWCDSDDMIHPDALSLLYNEAITTNADVVCGYADFVKETNGDLCYTKPISYKETGNASIDAAITSGAEFWLRLFKRTLIEKVGLICEDENLVFDDISYIPVVQSFAKKIRYISFPVYIYFRRSDSTAGTIQKNVCVGSVLAEKHAISHGNPKYIEAIRHLVAVRTKYNLINRWPYFDVFVNWTVEQFNWIENSDRIKADKDTYERLLWARSLADNVMPDIIYVNGFETKPSAERLDELKNKVFSSESQVVVLDRNSCDVYENSYIKRAYEQGNLRVVVEYFALKSIYRNGGMFVDEKIRILTGCGHLKYQNAFFSLVDQNTYSDMIYGAPANADVIYDILRTYSDEWDKQQKYIPLCERIAIILCSKYDIPFDGKNRMFSYPVSVISANRAVVDTRFGNEKLMCSFEHDFSAMSFCEDYVTIKRSSLEAVIIEAGRNYADYDIGYGNKAEQWEKELNDIKNSDSYKIAMLIKKIANARIFKPLKMPIKWLLRKRRA